MASFTTRVVVTRTVEYAVPSGDAMAEFDKAYVAARTNYRAQKGITDNFGLPDDWAHVHARDDEVVIAFQVETKED